VVRVIRDDSDRVPLRAGALVRKLLEHAPFDVDVGGHGHDRLVVAPRPGRVIILMGPLAGGVLDDRVGEAALLRLDEEEPLPARPI
jgi:hypothetical protein